MEEIAKMSEIEKADEAEEFHISRSFDRVELASFIPAEYAWNVENQKDARDLAVICSVGWSLIACGGHIGDKKRASSLLYSILSKLPWPLSDAMPKEGKLIDWWKFGRIEFIFQIRNAVLWDVEVKLK